MPETETLALTTYFKPAPSCSAALFTSDAVVDGTTRFKRYASGLAKGPASVCYPPGLGVFDSPHGIDGIYSPGVCPFGWHGTKLATTGVSQSICCPA